MTEQEKQELFDKMDHFVNFIKENDSDQGFVYGAEEMADFIKMELSSWQMKEFYKLEAAVT